jgi:ribosome maturation factor RimP
MMSTTPDRVGEFVAPLAAELELRVYDIEFSGGILRVLLDTARDSTAQDHGVDVDRLTEATRRISRWLDEREEAGEPVTSGPYALEVSSPGLERTLRTPEHFAGAVGESVRIKLKAGIAGERRIDGELVAANATTITVQADGGSERTVEQSDVERARTQFKWGPGPKPGSGSKRGKRTDASKAREVAPDGAPEPAGRDHATNSEALQ